MIKFNYYFLEVYRIRKYGHKPEIKGPYGVMVYSNSQNNPLSGVASMVLNCLIAENIYFDPNIK